MTMLEKAARAVFARNTWQVTGVERRLPTYDEVSRVERAHALDVARAVLLAIRDVDHRFDGETTSRFKFVIDAILAGEGE